MGNQPSNSSVEKSVMKKSSSQSASNFPSSVNNADGEAPPNYDDLFGAPPGCAQSRNIGLSSSASSGNPQPSGTALPVQPGISSCPIPPPSQAAWGTTTTAPHQEYSNPSVNWRQQEEEQELRMWFSAVDENNDGFITSEELRQALLNDNWTPFNLDTIKMMLKMFDRNMNDRIEFDEFAGLKNYVQEWKKVFDRYDLDRSGTIDVEEIRLAFGGMNYTFTLDFCTMLCRRFSLRSAGQINLDAFIYACAMVNAMSKDHARLPNSGSFEDFLRTWLNQPAPR